MNIASRQLEKARILGKYYETEKERKDKMQHQSSKQHYDSGITTTPGTPKTPPRKQSTLKTI